LRFAPAIVQQSTDGTLYKITFMDEIIPILFFHKTAGLLEAFLSEK
jgi:hypothetical protein